jgi:predicted acetyltransferase
MPIEIRAIDKDEVEQLLLADERGFSGAPHQPADSLSWAEGELDRTRIAFEDGMVVGVSRAYSFELTMPGGAMMPAAAVSWVSVQPTHRRRGVLTQMMNAMHDDARERGEPAAMLTASESVIYGRYGYGVATWRLGLSAERSRVDFRDAPDDSGSVRLLKREEARDLLPAIYDRCREVRAGMVSRPDFWWPTVFFDHFAGPKKAAFFAVHRDASGVDDGFVTYEVNDEWNRGLPDRRLMLWDIQAVTPAARVALWRFVFGIDLIGTVAGTNVPIDDPLRHLVRDSRRVRVDFINDGLWIAPLDPVALLATRSYDAPGRFVVEVKMPDGSAQTVAVESRDGSAQATRTKDAADVTCAADALGMCILGGNRWSELADAGRVEVHQSSALATADAMFTTHPAPAMLSYF